MKQIVCKGATSILGALYGLLKCFPIHNNKILFLSRQLSRPSLDFVMIQKELALCVDDLEMVFICNRMKPGLRSKLSYMRDMMRSLYHLATAKVCILDSYWPPVSILHHRPSLTVIQLWHSLGKIKQSGLQTLGKPGGRSCELASAMHMHENYDYIVAGAPIWNPFYCASFGCREDQLLNYGLPRMDYLTSSMNGTAASIKRAYPELEGKKVILYAPTFRRGSAKEHSDLVEALQDEQCILIVKAHLNQDITLPNVLCCSEYSGMQLLSVADLVITDYSAIALEAAAAQVPTLYYLYDYDEYKEKNGLNLDISQQLPQLTAFTVEDLAEKVHQFFEGAYPYDEFESYRSTYLITDQGHSTHDLATFILKCLAYVPSQESNNADQDGSSHTDHISLSNSLGGEQTCVQW